MWARHEGGLGRFLFLSLGFLELNAVPKVVLGWGGTRTEENRRMMLDGWMDAVTRGFVFEVRDREFDTRQHTAKLGGVHKGCAQIFGIF